MPCRPPLHLGGANWRRKLAGQPLRLTVALGKAEPAGEGPPRTVTCCAWTAEYFEYFEYF